jgi:hypothetical protein
MSNRSYQVAVEDVTYHNRERDASGEVLEQNEQGSWRRNSATVSLATLLSNSPVSLAKDIPQHKATGYQLLNYSGGKL